MASDQQIAVIGPENTITEIKEVRRGQRVTLKGEVVRLRDEDEFVLSDSTGQIDVYIGWRNDMPVQAGDQILVVGIADDDVAPGMKPEIYARTIIFANGDLVDLRTGRFIIKDESEESRPLVYSRNPKPAITDRKQPSVEEVTPVNQVKRGQRVTLNGVVHRIRDEDEFILKDDTGRIRIYIGWQNDMMIDVGDKVTVVGIADDDVLPFMRPEIYARLLVLANGAIVDLRSERTER